MSNTGDGTIKLVGAASLFGGLSGNNGQYILNSNVTSATLLTAFEGTFDATQRKVDYTDPRHPEKGSKQVNLKTVGKINVEKNFSNDIEIIGNAKKNNITSGKGDDALHGGAKNDKFHGGNDSLECGKGKDTLKGDKGNDTLRGAKKLQSTTRRTFTARQALTTKTKPR